MPIFLPIAEKKTYEGKQGSRPRRGDAPSRIVIHTTETAGLPGYREGSVAPHFTIGVGDPGSMPREQRGRVRIWQHISLDRTASALRHNPGTIETNHMGAHCVQIECITYIGDQDKAGIVGNKGKFPKALSKALAGLIDEIVATLDDININLHPDTWSSSGSYGVTAKQRLTEAEWERFNGICGHEHVPNNTHWDPGAFDIDAFTKLLSGRSDSSRSQRTSADKPAPPPPPPRPLLRDGDKDKYVLAIRGALQALGYGDFTSIKSYDDDVASAVKRLQADSGARVDGVWGPETNRYALARIATKLHW